MVKILSLPSNFSLALLRKHDIVYGNFHVLFLIGYLAKCMKSNHINFKFHCQENRPRQWLRDFDKTKKYNKVSQRKKVTSFRDFVLKKLIVKMKLERRHSRKPLKFRI